MTQNNASGRKRIKFKDGKKCLLTQRHLSSIMRWGSCCSRSKDYFWRKTDGKLLLLVREEMRRQGQEYYDENKHKYAKK